MIDSDLLNSLNRIRQSADAFAAGVRGKIDLSATWFFGGRPGPTVQADQSLPFKDLLANAALFDHELLARTVANPSWRCDVVRGWPGRLWSRRARVVAVVAVDLGEVIRRAGLAAGPGGLVGDWPALSADALDEALRDFRAPPPRTFVGVCSPSGFAPEAVELAGRRASSLSTRGGGLVLVTPRGDGGWVLRSFDPPAGEGADPNTLRQPWHFIFDPEPVDDKIERVRRAIEASLPGLPEAGLNDRALAARLDTPLELVRQMFRAEVQRRGELRVRELDGDLVLLGPADFASAGREKAMSMFQKLRELLGLKGQEARKIEMLADKRALLSSRRERMFRELDELGERERLLLERGIASESPAVQRRLAGELAEVRKRLEQGNTVASLVGRQVDVLSTHIHHLTLIQQGAAVQMPSVEEMTRDAVRAEELIERIQGEAELADTLGPTPAAGLGSKAEEQILAEFAAARQAKSAEQPERQPGRAGPEPESARPESGQQPPDRPQRDRPLKE